MQCHNCGKRIPRNAKACKYCETPVAAAPSQEEMDFMRQMMADMDPEVRKEMQAMIQSSKTADEFVNRLMVGDCPKCGSSKTDDCENDPEIENPCVGRCLECGYYWCTLCERTLDPKAPSCPCWEEDVEGLDELDEPEGSDDPEGPDEPREPKRPKA